MTWIPLYWQHKLLAEARARVGDQPDPLDPKVLASLQGHLATTGWFEETPTVRRRGTLGIVVEGRWRTPAAVVRFRSTPGGEEDVLWLSTHAQPMPKIAEPGQARPRVIVGPASGPPRNASGAIDFNTRWSGEDIDAALELLALVGRQPWSNQVAGVDISDFGAQESLTLVTTYATRVVFGGRPSRPRYGDAPTRDKLKHLATLFADTRRIDGGHPLVYVDSLFLMFDRSATAEAQRRRSPDTVPVLPDPQRPNAPAQEERSEPRRRT